MEVRWRLAGLKNFVCGGSLGRGFCGALCVDRGERVWKRSFKKIKIMI